MGPEMSRLPGSIELGVLLVNTQLVAMGESPTNAAGVSQLPDLSIVLCIQQSQSSSSAPQELVC